MPVKYGYTFSNIPTVFDENAIVDFFVVKPQTIWFNVVKPQNMPNSLGEQFEMYPRFLNHLATKYGNWIKNNESFIEVQRVVTFNNNVTVNTVTLPLEDLIYKINSAKPNENLKEENE